MVELQMLRPPAVSLGRIPLAPGSCGCCPGSRCLVLAVLVLADTHRRKRINAFGAFLKFHMPFVSVDAGAASCESTRADALAQAFSRHRSGHRAGRPGQIFMSLAPHRRCGLVGRVKLVRGNRSGMPA